MSMIQRIKCGNVNVYIVSEGDSAILVDTGKSGFLDTVFEACKPYRMKLIVLTHAHFDHTENAAALSEKLEIPVAMHKDDVDMIESNENQSMSAGSFLGKVVLSASRKGFLGKMKAFAPSVLLKDGDDLSEYGVPAKVSKPGYPYCAVQHGLFIVVNPGDCRIEYIH